MKLRQRTKNLLMAGSIGFLTAGLISSGIGYYGYSSMKSHEDMLVSQYQAQIAELEILTNESNEGYVLTADVEAGGLIEEDMVEKIYLSDAATSSDLLSYSDIIGSYSKVDMKEKTVLTRSIVFEEEAIPKDLRAAEYSFIQLPTALADEEYIDVRIQFPNGDDYIVLSKKEVKQLDGETVWIDMKEDEILTMSSAMVDAYFEEANIYALSYVEPYIQDAGIVTYPVKDNVLELIMSSPNVVNVARQELEMRNRARLERGLSEIEQDQVTKYEEGQARQQNERRRLQQEILNDEEEQSVEGAE